MKILKHITGMIKKGVDVVKMGTIDIIKSVEPKDAAQCKVVMVVGVSLGLGIIAACVVYGMDKLKYFKEIDVMKHTIEMVRLNNVLNITV